MTADFVDFETKRLISTAPLQRSGRIQSVAKVSNIHKMPKEASLHLRKVHSQTVARHLTTLLTLTKTTNKKKSQ